MLRKDVVGARFGMLVIIERAENYVNNRSRRWLCLCDCGNSKIIRASHLINKKTVSCGCYNINSRYRGVGELSGTYWAQVLSGAKKRKLKVNITPKYAWDLFLNQDKKCAISGVPIVLIGTGFNNNREANTASLDRIERNKGYIKGNVQWVHRTVNLRIKCGLSEEELFEWVKNIYNYRLLEKGA